MSPAALALAIAFAFANPQGTRLLATTDIASPEALHIALCSDNQQLAIQFERKQPEGKSSGRQTPQNFGETAGTLFRIVNGKARGGATCVLADKSFADGATRIPLTRPEPDARCSQSDYPKIQDDKGRPIVGCWPIGRSSAGAQVAIIEFSRRLSQALASLVVIDGGRRIYIDYPAEFKGPGSDMWRVDDGGEIHAEGFEVVCLLKHAATYVLAVDWGGAEGSALSLHVSEDGNQFKEVLTDSWYRSPI